MRIISGSHKGRRITAPKKLPVRPTADRAKEALFNILNNRVYFDELSVIDLFSGTGNIAYEFASRGAVRITTVDAHAGCTAFIAKTAEMLGFPITAIKGDALGFLQKTPMKADVIFADPPYDLELQVFTDIPKMVLERKLLNEGGVLIIEHSDKTDLSDQTGFQEQRKYGGSVFSFFENDSGEV